MTRRIVFGVGFALLLLAPAVAQACAVCAGDGGVESRLTYRLTTAFLTVLPLVVIGGFVVWFGRRARRIDAAHPPPVRPGP